jgi:hypothetical protein
MVFDLIRVYMNSEKRMKGVSVTSRFGCGVAAYCTRDLPNFEKGCYGLNSKISMALDARNYR